ncbi:MAG: cytochrome P450 [Caldilineaceae bacterium]
MTIAIPPMLSGGFPVVGHLFEMLRNREKFFKRGYNEHGELFTVKLGPQHVLVITGAQYNQIFYKETDKALNMQEGYAFLKEAIGEVLFVAGPETYLNQRPALQEVFKQKRMASYIQAMNVEVQRWLDRLGQSGETDLTQELLQLTQFVAGRAFIGPNFEQELGPDFWGHYAAISASINPLLPQNLPLPVFWRRDRAKKKIKTILSGIIQKRREHPEQYDDLITTLLSTPMKDGTIMSDEEIVTMFMGLIFAGHETTAGQAAWLLALLLQHPETLKPVQQEIREHVVYGQELDGHTLSQLNYMYWAIDETTRMRPSADTQIRTVQEPLKMGDYEIPVGWRIMVSGATSHFQSEVFANPDHFDPLRYSPERGEGKNPFAIIGFGGGIHKCTGMNFAKNEMAVITARFFQQFDAELLSKEVHVIMGNGANHPSPVRIRYQRKPLSQLTDSQTIQAAAAAGCPHIHHQVT